MFPDPPRMRRLCPFTTRTTKKRCDTWRRSSSPRLTSTARPTRTSPGGDPPSPPPVLPHPLPRYHALAAPFSRQLSFTGASRVLRVLGKKTSRAKESLLSKLGMIRSSSSMEARPSFKRQQSAWVERPLEEVEEGEEEEEKDTRSQYKQQKSCHF